MKQKNKESVKEEKEKVWRGDEANTIDEGSKESQVNTKRLNRGPALGPSIQTFPYLKSECQ